MSMDVDFDAQPLPPGGSTVTVTNHSRRTRLVIREVGSSSGDMQAGVADGPKGIYIDVFEAGGDHDDAAR